MRVHAMTLGVLLIGGLPPLAPSLALAQEAPSTPAGQIASEYQKLRTDLERINAEIAALKQGERSVRNDYRLRDKMAEAEALARKVTEAEARLRAAHGPSSAENPAGPVEPPVIATAQDGALELEAKADLLSDQARRFKAEADVLAHTAEQIRARQALRRRAGAWDRDPLAGFEASKRATFVVSQSSRVAAGGDSKGTDNSTTPVGSPERGGSGPTLLNPTQGTVGAVGSGSKSADSSGTTPGGTFGPGAAPPPPAVSTPVPVAVDRGTSSVTGSPSRSQTPVSAPTSTTDFAAKGAAERALLDPTALAAIRSNLSQAGSLSDPEAAETAAAALRRHAQALEKQARGLRARASQR